MSGDNAAPAVDPVSPPVENTGPLKGLKVVEMGQLIAGPFCGQLLGDMGADIIKIEPPGKGDHMPHFAVRESIVEVPHPRWGTVKMQNVFPKLSATPGRVRTAAPGEIGQHNGEVYAERLGLDAAALADLKAWGVI